MLKKMLDIVTFLFLNLFRQNPSKKLSQTLYYVVVEFIDAQHLILFYFDLYRLEKQITDYRIYLELTDP